MIFPKTNKIKVQLYRCPVCNKHYQAQTGQIRISCGVAHGPGSCCHYGEREITEEQLEMVLEIIKGNLTTHAGDRKTQS